jgi:hypothetical protein
MEVEVRNLLPSTSYELRLVPFNAVGNATLPPTGPGMQVSNTVITSQGREGGGVKQRGTIHSDNHEVCVCMCVYTYMHKCIYV